MLPTTVWMGLKCGHTASQRVNRNRGEREKEREICFKMEKG